MATPSPNAELQIGLHRLDANRYSVELQSRPPDSDADMAPVRGTTTFDLEVLRTAEWEGPDTVGKLLTERLFADPAILTHYQQACVAAETAEAVLRVRLFIGPTAPELHALKWELLRDPRTGTILATRERVVFSRYLSSHDWRPVRLRPQEALRALVVIANPTDLGKYKMAPVDVDGERKRARDALGEIPIVEVTGPETFPHLIDRLREEFDILYLVGHGALIDGEPTLWLESSTGARTSGPAGTWSTASASCRARPDWSCLPHARAPAPAPAPKLRSGKRAFSPRSGRGWPRRASPPSWPCKATSSWTRSSGSCLCSSASSGATARSTAPWLRAGPGPRPLRLLGSRPLPPPH